MMKRETPLNRSFKFGKLTIAESNTDADHFLFPWHLSANSDSITFSMPFERIQTIIKCRKCGVMRCVNTKFCLHIVHFPHLKPVPAKACLKVNPAKVPRLPAKAPRLLKPTWLCRAGAASSPGRQGASDISRADNHSE